MTVVEFYEKGRFGGCEIRKSTATKTCNDLVKQYNKITGKKWDFQQVKFKVPRANASGLCMETNGWKIFMEDSDDFVYCYDLKSVLLPFSPGSMMNEVIG